MAQRKLDNSLLIRCFSLWKRNIGRKVSVRHAIAFTAGFVAFVLMVLIGAGVAAWVSVDAGAGILLLALFCAALVDFMSGCNLIERDSDWPSDERKVAISRFIRSLKKEGEFEASDLPTLIAVIDEQKTLIDERIRGLQSLLTGVVAVGLFGAICSQAMSLATPAEGISLQETTELVLLLGVTLVALLVAIVKVARHFLDECIWMSRTNLSSCEEDLRLASMNCFEDCWIEGVSAGKHARRA